MYMNDGNKTKISLSNKSVFITGVAGFIGSNLAKRLLSTVEDVKVVGLDNMNHYYDGRFSARRSGRNEAYHTKNQEAQMKLNHNKKSVKISLNLFALYAVMVCGIIFALPAFAADDPLVVVENLSTFIFSLIRAVGLILLGWGIVQVGLSLQSHDPSQRSQGFLTLAGGLVITFAKEILDLITA